MTTCDPTPQNRLKTQRGGLPTDHRPGHQLEEPFPRRGVEPHVRRLARVPPTDSARSPLGLERAQDEAWRGLQDGSEQTH
jgi:hypothetical protein